MSSPLSVLKPDGSEIVIYQPYDYQAEIHASSVPNLLMLGTRNTGKSLTLRMDAVLRCLLIPNFNALILRRTMPELRESHLIDIEREAKLLGDDYCTYVSTPNPLVRFTNGSRLSFRHCETEGDIMDFLSSQYGFIGFDELSTFLLQQFLMISAAARAPKHAPYEAVVRAGSNPLGVGADWMYEWFVDKSVNLDAFPDYNAEDFVTHFSKLEDNKSADVKAYTRRLGILPEHVRRAWLLGERVIEGAYFGDFQPKRGGDPWHVVDTLPRLEGQELFNHPWLYIFRAVDWGYDPDPAVCLWIAVLPNKRAVVFKEMTWKKTLAKDVARDIEQASQGMRIVNTFADPTMEIKTGSDFSIGDIFERSGVPLTYMINDRKLYGYSIHEFLNTRIAEGIEEDKIFYPKVQILRHACPNLLRTFPLQRMDPTDPSRLGDGDDHWVIALAYFCMGQAPASRNPAASELPFWMRPKPRRKH